MKKVITYGTFDLLHYGHIRLLQRAKALGDWLIVGVTSDDFDKARGKINTQQSLMDRVSAIRSTGLADQIIVEEYEGQKIDDIRKYGVDVFTVGSDWEGRFDYLKAWCQVVYLPRTEGVSSSEVREIQSRIRLGIWGDAGFRRKIIQEASFVNGAEISGLCGPAYPEMGDIYRTDRPEELLERSDAAYILTHPEEHARNIRQALQAGRHVLCESPIALDAAEAEELFQMAEEKKLVLMDGIKTAYSVAYERLVLLTKTGRIGQVISVDAVCTSLRESLTEKDGIRKRNSVYAWGPTAMLPLFQILGTGYTQLRMASRFLSREHNMDAYTKMDFVYPGAVGSLRVAKGAKAEGELIVTGTEGYLYVPAPWWKTDYFEIRYENPEENRRFFYQLEGEGIRNEILSFIRAAGGQGNPAGVTRQESIAVCRVVEAFNRRENLTEL